LVPLVGFTIEIILRCTALGTSKLILFVAQRRNIGNYIDYSTIENVFVLKFCLSDNLMFLKQRRVYKILRSNAVYIKQTGFGSSCCLSRQLIRKLSWNWRQSVCPKSLYLSNYTASYARRIYSRLMTCLSDNEFKKIHYKVVNKIYGFLRQECRITL